MDKVLSRDKPLQSVQEPLTMDHIPNPTQLNDEHQEAFSGQLENIYNNLDNESVHDENPMNDSETEKKLTKKQKQKIAAEKHKKKKEEELNNPEGPPLIRQYIKTGKHSKKNKNKKG